MPELFIVLAVGYFLIILLTLYKRGSQGRIAQSLIIYSLISLMFMVYQYLVTKGTIQSIDPRVLRWTPPLIILFLSIWFVSLSRNFLSLHVKSHLWVITGLCWLAAVITTIVILSAQPEVLASSKTLEFRQDTLFIILIGLGYALMMGGAGILILRAYRLSKSPLHKNRNIYWMLALVCTVGGDIVVVSRLSVIAGSALHLVGTFFAAYVLLIYDLADALQAGIRVLVFLIVTILSIGTYLLVFAGSRPILENRMVEPLIFWAGLAILLVVLINPLLRLVTGVLRRSTLGVSYNTSNAVREYSLHINNIVDLEALTTVALDTIEKILDIPKGYLFLVDEVNEEGRIYYNLKMVQVDSLTASEGRLGSESPIAQYFTQTHAALRQYDLDYSLAFQTVPPKEREWLTSLEADVCVPISDKRGWIGLFVLGPKASGYPYTKEDVNLLSTLADQTAVALANARHFADLLALNEDLRRTDAALEKANQQLREVDELKSAFIGVITHEMRTPFANLQFNVQILEMYGKDHLLPEQRDQLAQLSKGIQAARNMVDNLITLASFFSRQIVLSPEILDIKEMMRSTFLPLKEVADEKNIAFQVDIVGKLLPVEGDRALLSTALYQLVHNAVKFTRDGGKVMVSCWTTADEFLFDVKDTGVGITPDHLNDIWKTFAQTADPLRRGLEGLGLGLALVKNIVSAHGGEVWVESKVGSGSVFGFKIPLAQRPAVKLEAKIPAVEAGLLEENNVR